MPVFFPWRLLHRIFGESYRGKNGLANFKVNFKKLVGDVLEIYPAAKRKIEF